MEKISEFHQFEESLGLSQQKFESKYCFSAVLKKEKLSMFKDQLFVRDHIYLKPGIKTPSQTEGISEEIESILRNECSEMIFQACILLKLPILTCITSQNIFHRFFHRGSFLKFDFREIVMASVFVATKLEDSSRKLRDIITVFYQIFQLKTSKSILPKEIEILDPSSSLYSKLRVSVIEIEKVLLKELGFELYRITDHPHKLMHGYLKLMKANNEVARRAWNYLNDSYRSSICVHYPPSAIAASSIYLALRSLSIPLPNVAWWCLMETQIDHINYICAEILNVYQIKRISIKEIKNIIDSFCVKNNFNLFFSLDFSDINENLNFESLNENNFKQNLENNNDNNIFKDNNNFKHKDKNDEYKTSKSIDKKKRDKEKENEKKNKKKNKHKSRRSRSKSSSSHSRSRSRHHKHKTNYKNNNDKYHEKDKKRKKSESPAHRSKSKPKNNPPKEMEKISIDNKEDPIKNKEKEKNREKEKYKEKEKQKERDNKKYKYKEKSKDHSRSKDKYKDKDKERDKNRENSKDRDRKKNKKNEKEKDDKSSQKSKSPKSKPIENNSQKENELKKEEKKILEEKKNIDKEKTILNIKSSLNNFKLNENFKDNEKIEKITNNKEPMKSNLVNKIDSNVDVVEKNSLKEEKDKKIKIEKILTEGGDISDEQLEEMKKKSKNFLY